MPGSSDTQRLRLRATLEILKPRPFKTLDECRRDWFKRLDRPALQPLTEQPYQYVEWTLARVGVDYHVEVARHFYSVSYLHVRQHGVASQTPDDSM